MSKFIDSATQCTILNDDNIKEHIPKPTLYTDDKEERSLSSLFNMFGIKYNRVTRSTTDSNSSTPCTTPITRGRVLPIDLPLSNSLSSIPVDRTSIPDSSLSEYTLMPWQKYEIDTPDTPNSYQHPWL